MQVNKMQLTTCKLLGYSLLKTNQIVHEAHQVNIWLMSLYISNLFMALKVGYIIIV